MIDLVNERDIKSDARYTIEAYYKGFRILLTQPFESGGAIIALIEKMMEVGFIGERVIYQAPQLPTPETSANDQKESENHMCPVHNVPLRRFEKNGKVWYSHKTDEGWCNGTIKQPN